MGSIKSLKPNPLSQLIQSLSGNVKDPSTSLASNIVKALPKPEMKKNDANLNNLSNPHSLLSSDNEKSS